MAEFLHTMVRITDPAKSRAFSRSLRQSASVPVSVIEGMPQPHMSLYTK